jgi:hypothetical protein
MDARLVVDELTGGRDGVPTLCSVSCRCGGVKSWSSGCGSLGVGEVTGVETGENEDAAASALNAFS